MYLYRMYSWYESTIITLGGKCELASYSICIPLFTLGSTHKEYFMLVFKGTYQRNLSSDTLYLMFLEILLHSNHQFHMWFCDKMLYILCGLVVTFEALYIIVQYMNCSSAYVTCWANTLLVPIDNPIFDNIKIKSQHFTVCNFSKQWKKTWIEIRNDAPLHLPHHGEFSFYSVLKSKCKLVSYSMCFHLCWSCTKMELLCRFSLRWSHTLYVHRTQLNFTNLMPLSNCHLLTLWKQT